jgi:O-methyltransferase involved in polyketide biosynthesis
VLPLLYANGFNPDSPSFFIWEGKYLTRVAAMKVLTDLCQGVRAFSIAFDYMDEARGCVHTGDRQTTGFVQRFAAMDAPWHFGIDPQHCCARS